MEVTYGCLQDGRGRLFYVEHGCASARGGKPDSHIIIGNRIYDGRYVFRKFIVGASPLTLKKLADLILKGQPKSGIPRFGAWRLQYARALIKSYSN